MNPSNAAWLALAVLGILFILAIRGVINITGIG